MIVLNGFPHRRLVLELYDDVLWRLYSRGFQIIENFSRLRSQVMVVWEGTSQKFEKCIKSKILLGIQRSPTCASLKRVGKPRQDSVVELDVERYPVSAACIQP